MQRGGGQGDEETAYGNGSEVRAENVEGIRAAIHPGPHQNAEEIDVHQEYAEENGERRSFGEEERREAQGLRRQHLVVAAVGEERVPFEDHEETHHRHGERNEHVADGHQVPSRQSERAEQKHEEAAGNGQDAEGLHDSGFRLTLR